jgi:acetyl-CoA carboxylase carboxyl transferase subunit alpha
MTSHDLKNLGIIDQILPEPVGGAHSEPLKAAQTLKNALLENLAELERLNPAERRQLRYEKFRKMGVFTEITR